MTDADTGLNATAYVSIIIPAPGSLPAADDYYEGVYNTPRSVVASEGILLNDGPSFTNATLSITRVVSNVSSADGEVTGLDLATGAFVFTPRRGFRGNTTFVYGACMWGRARGAAPAACVGALWLGSQ